MMMIPSRTLFLIESYCRDIFRFEVTRYKDIDCNRIALTNAWNIYSLYLSKNSIRILIAIGINDHEHRKSARLSAGLNSIRRHPIRVNSSWVILLVQCKYLIKLCIAILDSRYCRSKLFVVEQNNALYGTNFSMF
jgi:hypothetical protein